MLKGFKDFILRGNVIELAVAVVIGTAFTNVVTAFADSFVYPLIRLIGGGGDSKEEAGIRIRDQWLNWPAFLNALLAFLVTAAVVYFIFVYPMNKLAERRARGQEPEPKAPSDEIRLLTEIRDALVAQRGAAGTAGTAAGTASGGAPVRPGDPPVGH